MAVREINTRDAGIALASRINRWLIGGAVAGAGFLSLIAAHAFHGRTLGSTGGSSPAVSSPSTSSAGGGLQQPAQSPAPSAPSPTPVVSGGS